MTKIKNYSFINIILIISKSKSKEDYNDCNFNALKFQSL